jgi:hypothetical protein
VRNKKTLIFIVLAIVALIPSVVADQYAICVYDAYNNYARGAFVQVKDGPNGYTDDYGNFYANLDPNAWYYIHADYGNQGGDWNGNPNGRARIEIHMHEKLN